MMAGLGTSAVVWKAVIRKAFIRQMSTSIRAYLTIWPGSISLKSLGNLADRALASENDAKETQVGVAEIQVNESTKLIGLLKDLSRCLQISEPSGAKKKHFSHKQSADNCEHRNLVKPAVLPDVNAKQR